MSRKADEIDPKTPDIFRIGDFAFSTVTRELRDRAGEIVPLRSQSSDVLAELCASAGQVVPKETLIAAVWPDTFVTDDSLIQCIADIRRAIGDDEHKIVQTLPKKGYLLTAVPDVPGAMAAHPSPRFARLAALSFMAPAIIAIALFLGWRDDESPFDDIPTIAVLPFDDFSAGDDKGYLSDAIAEGLITELARGRYFRVIARNSSFRYRGTNTDVRQIGAELGAEYVLEGSKQKNGDRLRVTVQLVDAQSGDHVWANTYDQPIGDLFVVQDRIIRTVADRVGNRIERPVPGTDPDKVSALHYMLTGIATIRSDFNEENSAKAYGYYRQAIAADPDAPYGYVGSAHYYREAAVFGWHGLDREEALEEGLRLARRAIDIDPTYSGAHYVLARLLTETGDIDAANAGFSKAIELDPSASNYLVASTTPLLYIGETDLAIERLKEAMGIDPFHPDWYHWQMGWALWEKEDCAGALAAMRRMNKIPKGAQRMLAGIHACLGNVEEARAAYKVYYADAREPTISEQRAEWENIWTAPGSLDRWLDHMRIAGMKE